MSAAKVVAVFIWITAFAAPLAAVYPAISFYARYGQGPILINVMTNLAPALMVAGFLTALGLIVWLLADIRDRLPPSGLN